MSRAAHFNVHDPQLSDIDSFQSRLEFIEHFQGCNARRGYRQLDHLEEFAAAWQIEVLHPRAWLGQADTGSTASQSTKRITLAHP
jgi:hypothetical protein